MTTALATAPAIPTAPKLEASAMEQALIRGDLARLTDEQRMAYYRSVCESMGLNPLTNPFQYITLNGKLRLYATKDCTEQLRKIHGVSVTQVEKLFHEGLYIVTAHACDNKGRTDASTGAVTITGLKGESLANALMKAETKAKRRVTLSICGLGMLDETEAADIPQPGPAVEAVTKVVEGQTINTLTGEEVTDDGLLRVTAVVKVPTTSKRGCWKITLSDGRECYSFCEQESAIAEKFAQESRPVIVDVKESKRGLDLELIREFGKGPATSDTAPDPPVAVDASQIPF